MATILSIAELKAWTSITATDAIIESRKLIETVEQRLPIILNNYFTSEDICLQSTVRFNATAKTIILSTATEKWEDYGFLASDYMYIYGSYRNDKYVEIASITNNIVTLTSAYSVVDEYHNNSEGKCIFFARVDWPMDVKQVAAELCYYDYDVRNKVSSNIKSRSLGPLSESFTDNSGSFGYPQEILSKLDRYKLARLM